MAEYQSQYKSLMFCVNDQLREFSSGRYVTENKDEIEVLDRIVDAVRVEEPKQEKKAEEKPAVKEAPAKKASK